MTKPNFLRNGKPLFSEKIFITRPNLPSMQELRPKMELMLKSRWVTNFGDFHNELTDGLKKALKVKYVIPCCNATVALFLLMRALGLKGKVITTPFTFPATIHSISMAGMEPVFCDIDPDDYTLDPGEVRKNITSSVSAILAVNVFGNVCDVDALKEISEENGIPVIYDSAHSFFASYKGQPIGGFGTAEVFSFHATKLFTTLEGGAITTNDERLYKKLRLMINFGIKDEEHVVEAGLNAKMSEMNAIFGLISLGKMKRITDKLAGLNDIYRERLAKIPGIKFQKIRKGCRINNQYMPIEIIPGDFGLTRDMMHEALKYDNVIARKYFFPAGHTYDCYKKMEFVKDLRLPDTEKVSSRILCLPVYYTMNAGGVRKVCDLIESMYFHRKEISKKFCR